MVYLPTETPMKKSIISDIDGTLALIGNRDPFNPKTVADDLLNNPVANILEVYSKQQEFDIAVILVTGRFEKYRSQTETWLAKHHIVYEHLYMRKNGDFRKDTVVKKEYYEKSIRGTFDVLFVLEDRDQAVAMWRKDLGLTCLQVEYGNF
jgi:hypothetical protein